MGDQQTTAATPWHLWVVGGLLLIWNGFASFDYIATLIRFEPYLSGHPQDVLDYYFNAPAWMSVMWGGSMIGGFISSVFLLLRRSIAIPIAVIALICSCVVAVYDYINPSPISGGVMVYVIVLLFALLVIIYMYWLSRRGVLR